MRLGKVRRKTTAGSRTWQAVLGRLGIRGKLNLLLMLPLTAVVLVSIPYVATQAGNAQSAGQTSETAGQAHELGSLVWELQRELLLTVDYVASPSEGSGPLMQQHRIVTETVDRVRETLGPDAPDEVAAALVRIGSLAEIRANALRRAVSLDSAARTYHAVIEAVIDAPRLLGQKNTDAEGTRQLTSLDALLRANEEKGLRGMAQIIVAADAESGQEVLSDAASESSLQLERFVQQADIEHAKAVVKVDTGEEARRVDALEALLPNVRDQKANQAFIADVLTAVEALNKQRRTVQEQVTRQITDAATSRASSATRLAWLIGGGAALLLVVVAFLAIAVSRSIADPLRRLTSAATTVADLAGTELVRVADTEAADEQAPRLATIDVSSKDELGKLATAFNRVQSTAGELVERQALTRRNVSLMFANVAKRTQNLVGRQLALVDELERNEQDPRLLESLYRLDHLSTRLRRNAENLLVVSGTRDETRIAGPAELSTALRSALAEIEDYQRVRLGVVADVRLASVFSSDVVLIFAELLENATSFSPPESYVDVDTEFLSDGSLLVVIVDQGIGMTDDRLAEENRRLVERERLELAPTSVLGLFVVGRLARRHGLTVELVPTPGTGITARMVIPPALLAHRAAEFQAPPAWPESEPADEPGRLPALAVPGMAPRDTGELEDFRWFKQEAEEPRVPEQLPVRVPETVPPPAPVFEPVVVAAPVAPVAAPVAAPVTVPSADSGEVRGGLRRRVAGAQLPGVGESTLVSMPAKKKAQHDPEAAKSAFDAYESGFAKANAPAPEPVAPPPPPAPEPVKPPPFQPVAPPAPAAPPAARSGLTRRVPGAQLAPGLAQQPAGRQPARVAATAPRHQRDPNAERAAFDAFSTGLAMADRDTEQREESKE
ncbi:Signal transduction histidine kinase [Amycolatopsis xylanica]|uniref:histidine kinase n=1 Tax=Amycolatopsis xylanica TaxID=589385 RepID=A0A1H2YAX1_9PSEU|nr:nitrate- and nitrite sensing domain-containing protein [Amycolatopsis xylanica]SDX02296.1 Signal transduction histidine kinase [Amycolatopsis xylanica]